MEVINLSRTFIGEFLSIEEQETHLSLYKTLSQIDILPQLSETSILSLACISALPLDYFFKQSNTIRFIQSLSAHNRQAVLAEHNTENLQLIAESETIHTTLSTLFGIPQPQAPSKVLQSSPPIASITPARQRFKDLKNYQSILAEQIWQHLQLSSYSRCILQMPTGTGKTRTSIDIVCRSFNTHEDQPQVLWLCNTEELAQQALTAFVDTYSFLALQPVIAKNCMQTSKVIPSDTAQFLVASIQSVSANTKKDSLVKIANRGIDVNRLRLIVIDEAHIATAPTYKNALEALTDNGAPLLGLTATPGRGHHRSGANENEELAEFFNRNVFSLEFPGKDTIDELVSMQIMSRAFFHPIEGASIDSILNKKEIEQMHASKSIPKKLIQLISSDQERNATIASLLDRIMRDGKRVIYFGTSVEQSKLISGALHMMGHRSAHIDGNSGSERSSAVNGYKAGQIQCLCNYGVLSTGFDDPSTDVVFIGRITNSIVLYSQMIGRGLRGKLLGGTNTCDIYTMIDNIADLPENNEIYNYFSGYYDNT